ncbi:MAG: anaerobic ribonucleoside-triphosphate reductase activating protein [Patescibacteria group bacterium]|nr:anaerobic ribonucleoside-triphosphate reductase activating protein [Patescibacteria group bacterium]
MFIGGFQKFTMLDYPGKIATTVFTMGCNFRCPFCHNSDIVDPKLIDYDSEIKEEEILKFLKSRKGDLDGVCITGGEPTLQLGLREFIEKIKKMGFLVKIDTNGSYFYAVSSLIDSGLVDYWAIDIKTVPKKYKIMTKKDKDNLIGNIENSIKSISNSKSELELRTTIVPGYVNEEDIDGIINWINSIDKKIFSKLYRYSVQNFRPEKTLAVGLEKLNSYSTETLEIMAEKIRQHCKNVVISE